MNKLSHSEASAESPAAGWQTAVFQLLSGGVPVDWSRSAGWYLRALGAIYLFAFVSLWSQIHGLIGSEGIAPIRQFLLSLQARLGHVPWWQVPTLCWINASDGFLTIQCAAGVVISLLATLGIAQLPAFALLWLLYLSLTVAGQVFLGYQWDGLLLEAGLLAIFLSPLQWLAWKPRWEAPPIIVMWLQRWLVFRVMFLSGVVKLASGDPNWRNLSALTYHYWTQPLPTWTSYYVSHWPVGFQKFSAVNMFVIELGLPLLMFGPRRLRTLAATGVVFLQLLIMATGNYGFFNLLTIALCIPLLDDSMLPRLWPGSIAEIPKASASGSPDARDSESVSIFPGNARLWITGVFGMIIILATTTEFIRRCGLARALPTPVSFLADAVSPLRSTNAYGLFAVMTTDRLELIFEGSNDDEQWSEYRFKWKAGNLRTRPCFCVPHMPRLDWQMWFAGLDVQGNAPTIEGLIHGILRGSKPVMALLGGDPFGGHPPRYVRVTFYHYRFSTAEEGARSGDWWVRTDTGMETQPYTIGSLRRSTSEGE